MDIIIFGCCRSGHNFIRNQIDSWGLNTFNYEDVIPGEEVNIVSNGVYPKNPKQAIVVRNPYNWWASYIKWLPKRYYGNIDNAFYIWYQQAKEALKGDCVLYDRFKDDKGYRTNLCKKLGGTYTESRLEYISSAGGGSSFYGGNTSERYKEILDTKYKDIYLEYLEKYKEIFNFFEKKY